MKNGINPNEFLEDIYSCQDMWFDYDGIKYQFGGWYTDVCHMHIYQYDPPTDAPDNLWECEAPTADECLKGFLAAPIFGGKTFWEVEQDIDWNNEF